MSTATREERLARRVADLYATDEQFANARPSEAVTAATEQPGLRLPQIVHTVMEAYAERQGVHETRDVSRITLSLRSTTSWPAWSRAIPTGAQCATPAAVPSGPS